MINLNDYFDGGGVLPGFSGMGSFRGRKAHELDEDERTIVEHFFTNDDSNVYAVKDTMPSTLWALLMGQYARSAVPVKERLLNLMKDLPKKDTKAKTLTEIALEIRASGRVRDSLDAHSRAAEKFIEEYGIDYGHASLRDSGTVRICFEGVSQRATKFLEAAREGAYQEQSTRATPFTIDNLAIPFEVRGTPFELRFVEIGRSLMGLYEKIKDSCVKYLQERFGYLREEADKKIRVETGDANAKLNNGQWDGVVNAKAFDIARALLPQNITTSLGMTLNVRRFQDMLTEWQSCEFEEIQLLGRAAQIEAIKISPNLMRYGDPSDFYRDLPGRGRGLVEEFLGSSSPHHGRNDVRSDLIAYTPDIENLVLASILFGSDSSGRNLQEIVEGTQHLTLEQKRKIAKSQFDGKKDYEINPKRTEIGTFTFSRLYDIGGYRDLQRQRGDRQQVTPYNTHNGFYMPEEIDLIEGRNAEEYMKLLGAVSKLHDDLRAAGLQSAAEYAPVMAHMISHIVTMDPNQLFYQAKLRTQPAGADSYREVALQEIRQGLELLPSFKGIVPFDGTQKYPLNRLPETVNAMIRKANKKV